jgi:hypothetical protein
LHEGHLQFESWPPGNFPVVVGLTLLGVFLAVLGGFVMWTATGGRDWNSTHNRAFQPTPRVGMTQERYNTVLGRVVGPLLMACGVVVVVLGVTGKR